MHPGKTSIGRLGEGGQSAGRYKLQKGGCNRIFPISINENLLKQICEICSVISTGMLSKIVVANRQLTPDSLNQHYEFTQYPRSLSFQCEEN